MPCQTAKLKLDTSDCQRLSFTENSTSLRQVEWLVSPVHSKGDSVSENLYDTVLDTGASVSYLSPELFVCLCQEIQFFLKLCSNCDLTANQGQLILKSETEVSLQTASTTFRHSISVFEAPELVSLLKLTSLRQKSMTVFLRSQVAFDLTYIREPFPSRNNDSALKRHRQASSGQKNLLDNFWW